MKRIMKQLAVCAVLSLVCICAHAQSKAFNKLAKIDGVEFVHIDKSMLEVAAEQGNGVQVGDIINLGNTASEIIKVIDDIMVFHCEEEESAAKLKKSAQKLLKGKKWQTLVDMNGEDGETVKICQAKEGDKTINVIMSIEDDEAQLVVINGTLDLSELLKKMSGTN